MRGTSLGTTILLNSCCCSPSLSGLVYRPSSKEDWPELVGKMSASGSLLPVGKAEVRKVFESLKRMAGDEKRMLQVRMLQDVAGED